MNSLLTLQLGFSHTKLMKRNDIEKLLNNSSIFAVNSPVAIYQNTYQKRLVESLAKDYPALNQLLESESFKDLALEYIDEYPSSSFSLPHFGQHLSTFLKQEPAYKKQPYLAELAEFEWQLVDVFNQADSPIASITDMARFNLEEWPLLTIKLHASVRWITMHWNLIDIYLAFRTESEVPDLIRFQSPKQYLVWRKEYSPHFRFIDAREWLGLKIMGNSNFSELCQTLAELDDNEESATLDATTYLKSWLSTGLIESVDIPHNLKQWGT